MAVRSFPRTIRSLVLSIAAASGLVISLLGFVTYTVVHEEIERQIDHRIELEISALLDVHERYGFDSLLAVVASRNTLPPNGGPGYFAIAGDEHRGMGYLVEDASGRRRAGDWNGPTPPPGWSEFARFSRPNGSAGVAQAFNAPLPGGGRLVVAADRVIIDQVDINLLRIFLINFGLIVLVSGLAAAGFGRMIAWRMGDLKRSSEAILAGDLSRRMPLDGSGGEFDQLAAVLNRMLDRISALLGNLQQVSGDIAHDLRTPLSRLRARLEAVQRAQSPARTGMLIQEALADADDLLELLSSLLAISEIEGQSVRSRFSTVDLAATVAELAEAYEPAMEAAGLRLVLDIAPAQAFGDRRLLQRCLSNLLDNALAHTPRGTTVEVRTSQSGQTAFLRVSDDGPGIPPSEHGRVFQRFVRLDNARSAAGYGLGLSMVAAIVSAHHGQVSIQPARTGVAIEIRLGVGRQPAA